MVEMTVERARRINENMVAIMQAKMSRLLVQCQRGVWTHGELHEAFRSVQNPRGWKFPVEAVVPQCDVDLVCDAIDYIVGGGTLVVPFRGRAKVYAPGYYAMVGA